MFLCTAEGKLPIVPAPGDGGWMRIDQSSGYADRRQRDYPAQRWRRRCLAAGSLSCVLAPSICWQIGDERATSTWRGCWADVARHNLLSIAGTWHQRAWCSSCSVLMRYGELPRKAFNCHIKCCVADKFVAAVSVKCFIAVSASHRQGATRQRWGLGFIYPSWCFMFQFTFCDVSSFTHQSLFRHPHMCICGLKSATSSPISSSTKHSHWKPHEWHLIFKQWIFTYIKADRSTRTKYCCMLALILPSLVQTQRLK